MKNSVFRILSGFVGFAFVVGIIALIYHAHNSGNILVYLASSLFVIALIMLSTRFIFYAIKGRDIFKVS
jgi:uncharacterized membrane protein